MITTQMLPFCKICEVHCPCFLSNWWLVVISLWLRLNERQINLRQLNCSTDKYLREIRMTF